MEKSPSDETVNSQKESLTESQFIKEVEEFESDCQKIDLTLPEIESKMQNRTILSKVKKQAKNSAFGILKGGINLLGKVVTKSTNMITKTAVGVVEKVQHMSEIEQGQDFSKSQIDWMNQESEEYLQNLKNEGVGQRDDANSTINTEPAKKALNLNMLSEISEHPTEENLASSTNTYQQEEIS